MPERSDLPDLLPLCADTWSRNFPQRTFSDLSPSSPARFPLSSRHDRKFAQDRWYCAEWQTFLHCRFPAYCGLWSGWHRNRSCPRNDQFCFPVFPQLLLFPHRTDPSDQAHLLMLPHSYVPYKRLLPYSDWLPVPAAPGNEHPVFSALPQTPVHHAYALYDPLWWTCMPVFPVLLQTEAVQE